MTYPNTVISMPSQLFTMRSSFKAVANGSIYVGRVNTDPTIPSNQIQVYLEQEDGNLIPVSQPIKINSAGYPTYSGQVGKFVVTETNHSMYVLDAYGAEQFTYPDVYKMNPAGATFDLIALARSNNVEVENITILQISDISGVNYFYEPASQTTYYSPVELTGSVSDIGTDVDGVRTIIVDASPYVITTIGNQVTSLNGIVSFKPDGASSAVANMMVYASPRVGDRYSTGNSIWKVVEGSAGAGKLAISLGLFAIALNGAHADDWSVDGETFTDVEIQSALDYADGTRGVRLGANTFIIENQVNMITSTNESDIYQSGNSIVGSGKDKTKIINRCGDAWILHKPSVNQASIGVRFQGFKLNGMSVLTDGSSLAGSKGAVIYSAWQGECRDYQETGMLGNAFSIPLDDALNSNPDRYACGIFTMDSVRFQSNEGIGLNCENPSLTLTLDNYYILGNKLGGLFLTGASHNILSGSIAANGEDAGSDGYGLHLAHSPGFTQHNVRVFGAEIDNNYGRSNIIVDGFNNNIECRIIQSGIDGFNINSMIYFNSSISGAAKNNKAKLRIRVDNASGNALNIVTTTDTAGTQDNHVDILYGVTGDDSNVVKANLLGTSRKRNTVSENGHVIGNSHQGPVHSVNKVFIRPDGNIQLDATAKVLTFSTMFDDFGLWNNSANKFTCPHRGICTVNFSAPFRAIIANDPINLFIKVNGATVSTIEFGDGVTRTTGQQTLSFNDSFAVNSGDEVEIWGSSLSNAGAYLISDGDSTISIRME